MTTACENKQNQGIDDCNSCLFSLKMSIIALTFYWRNDTPSFVTWRCRLATAPDTPLCIVIHGGQFTGGVRPPNQFVHEIVSPLPCSPAIVRHTLLIRYFLKELISFIGSLDKCHTSVFSASNFTVLVNLIKIRLHVNFADCYRWRQIELQTSQSMRMEEQRGQNYRHGSLVFRVSTS